MRTKQQKMPFMAVVILCLMASNPEPLSSQAIESHSLNRSVLWKIEGNGLKDPSYLFGTVHILDSSKFFLSETVIEQLSKCQAVVFESNIDEPGYQQKALQYSYMKNDSLENILSEKEYEDLNQFFKTEFNFPLKAVKKMKPFYLASVINALSLPKSAKSYDNEILLIAKDQHKIITGITSIEKESEVLNKIPVKSQLASLWEEIREHKNGYKTRDKMMQLYNDNDIDGIYTVITADTSPEGESLYEYLFPRRHDIWIPEIENLMTAQSCFFTVGVGHLPGPEGVINLLREKGYDVSPVNMSISNH